MSTQSILTRVLTATTRLLPSQSLTLAVLVAAAGRRERPDLAQIGRGIAVAITARSALKRAWRFTCDRRVEVADAMADGAHDPLAGSVWLRRAARSRRGACRAIHPVP